jgi:hypothetical protein
MNAVVDGDGDGDVDVDVEWGDKMQWRSDIR